MFVLILLASVLAAAGSVLGLLDRQRIYGKETTDLFLASTAQDLVNLFVVSPLMVVLAVAARRGSNPAWRCLLGLLGFTAYNYAIYCFSIHFGPLFLLWVAVLGLAVFGLLGSLSALLLMPAQPAPKRSFAAWYLMSAAAVFATLWLSEIVPDLLAGRGSTAAATWNLPTSPVHVLDLALFLPAVFLTGLLLMRGRNVGVVAAPGAALFLAATAMPPIVIPFVLLADGRVQGWVVVVPMLAVIVGAVIAVARILGWTPRARV